MRTKTSISDGETFLLDLSLREKSLKLGDGLKRSQILLIFFLWSGAVLSALQTSTDFTDRDNSVNRTEMLDFEIF